METIAQPGGAFRASQWRERAKSLSLIRRHLVKSCDTCCHCSIARTCSPRPTIIQAGRQAGGMGIYLSQ